MSGEPGGVFRVRSGWCTVTMHGWEAAGWNGAVERLIARCGGFGTYFKNCSKVSSLFFFLFEKKSVFRLL